MFLKSLTLKGFKSFADSTTMVLEPGVTVVVGPNGSGKSNVVDAVAWVLGAQAPKSVRSQKMDDVIFAGTAVRPALGRAEVSLTIDNSAGTLGVELSEITVTRILFRSGESEYAINGVPCRLLDVQELLSDAGVGRQQHVIVSQGQIDGVLNARPEDRRAIIEEAAGVLKFRKRREKAERRLDATEANLLRVQDLLREVRRQLRPLERQAKAAERHGALVDELGAVKTYVAGREIAALRVRLESLAATKIESASSETELKAALAALDTTVMSLEAELSARGASDLGDRLARAEQLRERARGLGALLTERRRSLERDRGHLLDADVVASLEADVARFRSELAAVGAEIAAITPEADALAADEAEFAAARDTVQDEATSARAARAAAEVRGELRSVRAALERSESDLRRAEQRRSTLADRLERVAADIVRLRADCDRAEAVEEQLVPQVAEAERALAAATEEAERVRLERNDAAEAASGLAARVEALQLALDAARARAGAEQLDGVDGVLGTLLELIEVDEGWQPAVEAALGEALSAVVVEDPAAGRRALEALTSSATGGAVIAPTGEYDVPPPPPTAGTPVRGHARSAHPDVDRLLDALLGNAVHVADVDAAVDTALAHPAAIVVTSAGDRFGMSGWRIGAGGSGATAAALAEAEARHAEAASALVATYDALAVAEESMAAARRREHELTRELDANDARFTAASEGIGRAHGERREIEAEIETLGRTIDDAGDNNRRIRERIAELEATLPELESAEQEESDQARAREALRVRLETTAAALAARRQDLEVRNAGLHERRQLLERRIAEAESRLQADTDARAAAEGERTRIERSLVAIDRLGALVGRHRAVIADHHGDLAEQRRRQSDEVRAMTAELEAARRQRAEREAALDSTREHSRKAELDEAEAKLRLESAIETLRRELDIEPATAVAAPLPDLPEGATPAGRVRELERELRLLGPINPLALEEFNELQTRHQFLEEQLDDVRTTRRELSRVIAAVDAEIQSIFAAAYADVSANFSELFGLLFPGGVGKLRLTEPDDLLRTGIEIEAKPSGKNVKKLSLLSGGERSLTALAYLFAVFRSRPSPFYVMDEVEAALDDVNLHRFLGLVHEFRRDAQLIIVSHQKRTMEAGDSLLGVTMQPGGSSKVVTERVSVDQPVPALQD